VFTITSTTYKDNVWPSIRSTIKVTTITNHKNAFLSSQLSRVLQNREFRLITGRYDECTRLTQHCSIHAADRNPRRTDRLCNVRLTAEWGWTRCSILYLRNRLEFCNALFTDRYSGAQAHLFWYLRCSIILRNAHSNSKWRLSDRK